MIIFLNCNSWALIHDNTQICATLNQMCNKIFSSAFNDPLKYSKLSVSSIFYGITAGRDQ